jgi:hypothetical protein
LQDSHKALIFSAIEKIVKENIDSIDKSIALEWIEIASNEMIQNKENSKENNKENVPSYLQTTTSHLLGYNIHILFKIIFN